MHKHARITPHFHLGFNYCHASVPAGTKISLFCQENECKKRKQKFRKRPDDEREKKCMAATNDDDSTDDCFGVSCQPLIHTHAATAASLFCWISVRSSQQFVQLSCNMCSVGAGAFANERQVEINAQTDSGRQEDRTCKTAVSSRAWGVSPRISSSWEAGVEWTGLGETREKKKRNCASRMHRHSTDCTLPFFSLCFPYDPPESWDSCVCIHVWEKIFWNHLFSSREHSHSTHLQSIYNLFPLSLFACYMFAPRVQVLISCPSASYCVFMHRLPRILGVICRQAYQRYMN